MYLLDDTTLRSFFGYVKINDLNHVSAKSFLNSGTSINCRCNCLDLQTMTAGDLIISTLCCDLYVYLYVCKISH